MSYVALARKWRPRTFSQLVGQEHITKALKNSLNQQRLHHAYLFTGTRGVGKTSIARILAKALNCQQGLTSEPCLNCDACLAIEQGRFIDLIEIDGASRTRVEDTRELLDNVQYVPTSGRFKIYLIDEVHMLSTHSFNALLKTLEEPPPHVKFFLATTEPQKLPITVLSRCLQFNLKHVQATVICQYLKQILDNEQLAYQDAALDLLATAARGSMRDALSLLDQAIASSENTLQTQDVKNILGITQQDYALQLIQALAELAPQKMMTISKQIAEEGGHFQYVIDQMLNHLHQISIGQHIPHDTPFLCPTPEILDLSKQLAPEDVQLFYQICLKATEDIHLAPTLLIGFEMMLLRMYTFKPAQKVKIPSLAYQTKLEPISEEITKVTPCVLNNDVVELKRNESNESNLDWGTIIPQLKLNGLALTAVEHAELINKSENTVLLRISKGHKSLFTAAVIKRIEQGLTNYYKEVIKLELSNEEMVLASPAQQRKKIQEKNQEGAVAALQNDPFFQQLQEEFSAELVSNSIASLKDDII